MHKWLFAAWSVMLVDATRTLKLEGVDGTSCKPWVISFAGEDIY